MPPPLKILPLTSEDISCVTNWARIEGFAPGVGDVSIFRHTDRQGLWVAWLNNEPIGCIAGVRYNRFYGFIGLFLVVSKYRGNGYGVKLWRHALDHLSDLPCIGLEAATERINDYAFWGFNPSSSTTRWQWDGTEKNLSTLKDIQVENKGLILLEGSSIPSEAIQIYDAKREPSPRPHFISDWLHHPAGKVMALTDNKGHCHGFGRIRPCLLPKDEGWRIGPLLADTPELAQLLLSHLMDRHQGAILFDSPGANPFVKPLLERLGFNIVSETLRMYKGKQPPISMNEVYGLACLELG